MFQQLKNIISGFSEKNISAERQELLKPLVEYIQNKISSNQPIRLNFICTHNSRRSHLAQIWAQTMAYYFGIKSIDCYSGGTEATAMFPKVAETLSKQGFQIQQLSENQNPIYAIKYDEDEVPIICFSKVYHHDFNPQQNFGAIMTCNHADEGCPLVVGAEARFPIQYNDPKEYDGSDMQSVKYAERSLEIAQEMWWVFMNIRN